MTPVSCPRAALVLLAAVLTLSFSVANARLPVHIVPPDWGGIPRDASGNPLIHPGQSFRLLFVTEGVRTAGSAVINEYNTFVQQQAGQQRLFERYQADFRALVSTASPDVDARDNTETHSNAPISIYYFKGDKVADDYAGFYSGNGWDSQSPRDQNGNAKDAATRVWTGSLANGTGHPTYKIGQHSNSIQGAPATRGREIHFSEDASRAGSASVYALSPVFTVEVSAQQAAMESTLAAFGRSLGGQVIDMIEARAGGSSVPTSSLTLGGHTFHPGPPDPSAATPAASGSDADLFRGRSNPLSTHSVRDLLSTSAFEFSLAEGDDGAPALTVWGGGAYSDFAGQPQDDGLRLDGDLWSVAMGLEVRPSADLLTGVAVRHSEGGSDYRISGGGGLDIDLTSVHPYLHYTPRPGLGLWASVGYGQGNARLSLKDDDGDGLRTDLALGLLAAGASRELLTFDTFAWSVKSDALLVRLDADGEPRLPPVDAGAERLRLQMEGQGERVLAPHARVRPRLALGARWDGGDAEGGLGAEVSAGLTYVDTQRGLRVSGQGHYLLTHREDDFEEWGLSVRAAFDPGTPGRGLSLSLTPTIGHRSTDSLQGGVSAPGTDLRMRAAWTTGVPYGRGHLTPYGEMHLSPAAPRVGLALTMPNHGLKVELYGQGTNTETSASHYEVGIQGQMRF